MDRIGESYRYEFSWVCLEKLDFYALAVMMNMACYWLNGTDGLNGTEVGQGWDGSTNASRRHNGKANIGYRGAAGGGNWWLPPIVSVLQGRGLFVSEHKYAAHKSEITRSKI